MKQAHGEGPLDLCPRGKKIIAEKLGDKTDGGIGRGKAPLSRREYTTSGTIQRGEIYYLGGSEALVLWSFRGKI